MSEHIENLRQKFLNVYSKEALLSFQKIYFKNSHRLAKMPFVIVNKLISKNMTVDGRKLPKEEIANWIFEGLLKKDVFLDFLNQLTPLEKMLVEHCIWNIPKSLEHIQKLGLKLFKQSASYWKGYDDNELASRFSFLKVSDYGGYYGNDSQVLVYLPKVFRQIAKLHLEKLTEYELKSVKRLPKNLTVFQEEKPITTLELCRSYVLQGQLKQTNSGAFTIASVRKMIKACGIEEFFIPKVHRKSEGLRTKFISEVFADFNFSETLPIATDVKLIVNELIQSDWVQDRFLEFFKEHLRFSYQTKIRGHITDLLWQFLKFRKEDGWLCIDAIYRHLRMNEIDPGIVSLQNFLKTVELKGYGYQVIAIENYEDYVLKPSINGIFFFLASFGILDVAYRQVQTGNHIKYSIFETLEYIRITEFGRYVLGQTEIYEESSVNDTSIVHADNERLILALEGESVIKEMLLNHLSEKVLPNTYQVTLQSFLASVNSEAELELKIKQLKSLLPNDMPLCWIQFFKDLELRVHPYQELTESYVVMKLDKKSPLIKEILSDSILKKYILKAEHYHVLVRDSDLKMFRTRVRQLGYLLDDT
mgnify:FL=1